VPVSFEWQAGSWLAWARTPGHDAYWQYRDAFFEELLPAPGRLTLEVGCGEGRVARDLTRRGHLVVALDASPTLAASAAAADPDGRYLVADAGRFQSTEPDAPFVIPGSYLGRHRVDEPFEHDGLQMHFTGWRYPLEAYARALEDAGLLIDRLREPAAPATAGPAYGRWQRLPNFLHIRAVKAR
jgi:SAM-dependent methyltransferase